MTATQTPGRGRPPGDMNPAGRSQQPRPGTSTDWGDAACLHYDPRMWDAPRSTTGGTPDLVATVRARNAITICHTCPIRSTCLLDALDHTENRRGVIRGGWVFDDHGARKGACRRCGRPVLANHGGRCEDHPAGPACGTVAGEMRHRRDGEPPCDECAEARRVYNRSGGRAA